MKSRMRAHAWARRGALGWDRARLSRAGLVPRVGAPVPNWLVLHNTGREGEGEGGGGGRVERETLLLVVICLSLGGRSCHGTGWAGRGLLADSEP